jgi:cold shock protein
MRETGEVVSFEETHGWIKPDSGARQVFVHFTDLQMQGYKELWQGDLVEFEIEQGSRGPHAARVRVMGRAADEDSHGVHG